MSKSPCKGIKKDGSPCRGQGLDQFDGHCIAHAPADITREWRARGGKNSATAARLDNRIPERLKQAMDLVRDSMNRVAEGSLSPAACNAVCRSAKTLIDLHRLADEEMDVIRTEEVQAAAAEVAGTDGSVDILDAADAIVAQQEEYNIESLVRQGLADLVKSPFPDEPPYAVLNFEGRNHFGYHRSPEQHQEQIDELKDQVRLAGYGRSDLSELYEELGDVEESINDLLAAVEDNDNSPHDARPDKLPARVRPATAFTEYVHTSELDLDVLNDLLRQVRALTRLLQVSEQNRRPNNSRSQALLEADPELAKLLPEHERTRGSSRPGQIPGSGEV